MDTDIYVGFFVIVVLLVSLIKHFSLLDRLEKIERQLKNACAGELRPMSTKSKDSAGSGGDSLIHPEFTRGYRAAKAEIRKSLEG